MHTINVNLQVCVTGYSIPRAALLKLFAIMREKGVNEGRRDEDGEDVEEVEEAGDTRRDSSMCMYIRERTRAVYVYMCLVCLVCLVHSVCICVRMLVCVCLCACACVRVHICMRTCVRLQSHSFFHILARSLPQTPSANSLQ